MHTQESDHAALAGLPSLRALELDIFLNIYSFYVHTVRTVYFIMHRYIAVTEKKIPLSFNLYLGILLFTILNHNF